MMDGPANLAAGADTRELALDLEQFFNRKRDHMAKRDV
jgi:hypothetical protein